MLKSINENSEKSTLAPLAILIPAYNEETTIAQTLDSLTSQTWIPEKIIVIDGHKMVYYAINKPDNSKSSWTPAVPRDNPGS